jgi:hypothetical protein
MYRTELLLFDRVCSIYIIQAVKASFQYVFGHGTCSEKSPDSSCPNRRSNTAVLLQNDISGSCFFSEDMTAINGVYLRCHMSTGDEEDEEDEANEGSDDSEQASEGPPKGALHVQSGVCLAALYGPSSVFPTEGPRCTCTSTQKGHITECEILLLWRVENGHAVKWLAARMKAASLPSGHCWHNTSIMKLYVSSAAGPSGGVNRASIVACLQSPAEVDKVSLVKIDLSDVEYSDVTGVVGGGARGADEPHVFSLSAVIEAIDGTCQPDVRTREVQTSGVVSDVLCSTPRGIVGVVALSARTAAARKFRDDETALASGWGESIVVVDVEEDEDADEDDENDGDDDGNDAAGSGEDEDDDDEDGN